jgi:hypothetical protein
MGWFGKKDKGKKALPDMPELPKLPELPRLKEPETKEPLPQLPSFPRNIIGEKFSQDAIKEAVTGEKEVDMEEADEFESSEMRTMPAPPTKEKFSRDISEEGEEIPKEWKAAATKVKKAGPVFIRIDKFEQTLKTFDKAKEKIMDIEKTLKEIRKLKDKEEEELNNWEKEIQTTKEQIERVDKELFSKVE